MMLAVQKNIIQLEIKLQSPAVSGAKITDVNAIRTNSTKFAFITF